MVQERWVDVYRFREFLDSQKAKKNYTEATTDCKRRGGHLATVCTEAEEAEIVYSLAC